MKYSAVSYWLIGIAIAAVAIGASFYFDDAVWNFIQQHQNRGVYDFMRNVSRFGDWPSHVVLGLLLLGTAWIRGTRKWSRVFLAMLIALALAGVTGTVIKGVVPRPRPSVHTDIRWGGPHFSTKYHSFPSGHVGASTAFFGVLFIARRRVGVACRLPAAEKSAAGPNARNTPRRSGHRRSAGERCGDGFRPNRRGRSVPAAVRKARLRALDWQGRRERGHWQSALALVLDYPLR